jgi:hypothetical protein
MSLKLVVTGVVVGAIGVSSAIAAPLAGKGKPPATGAGCKPRIAVVLKGTLASTPGPSATSISVKVTSGNHWGGAYVAASQPRSIGVDSNTNIRREGQKTLAALLAGDLVLVQARVCKADLANNATPALTASKVVAHPASSGKKDDQGEKNGKDDDNDND